MKISETDQAQRLCISRARSELWNLIYNYKDVDGDRPTSAEWLYILHEMAGDYVRDRLKYVRASKGKGE